MIGAQTILRGAPNTSVPVYKQLKGEDEGLPRNQKSKDLPKIAHIEFLGDFTLVMVLIFLTMVIQLALFRGEMGLSDQTNIQYGKVNFCIS